jgi:hypothetical protein
MALVRQRVRLDSGLPADEIRRRLAAATTGWAGGPFGRAVPPPPWPADGTFVACERTEGRWLALPVVVSGAVRPLGDGARVTALIRPHGWAVAPYLLAAALLSGPAFAAGAPLFGALWLVLVVATALHNLTSRLSERSAAIRDLLAEASGVSGAAARAS